ncbi:MAG: PAS domain-containing protein [Gammaproteobacteria bacterium]|nr:PAS domain-containing protein [Gammaproteobacteria bacterium]
MKDIILDQLNLYIWAKDKNFRYVYCNEHYAMAAGLDSPHQIIGKSDTQLPWRKLAELFKVGDYDVLNVQTRINTPEVSDTINDVKEILVTENQLLNSSNKCIGVVGTFVDITGKQLVSKTGHFDISSKRYYLGEDFGNEYLTHREVEVFRKLLLGYTAKQMGEVLNISAKTIESYIDNLRRKLQAKNKGEIIATAIQFGLTHIIHLNWYNDVYN